MTQTPRPDTKDDEDKEAERETKASTPERAPHESNYGYETDHPSYRQRKAGDWTPKQPASRDYRPADPPDPSVDSKP